MIAFHQLGDVACHELFVLGAALGGTSSDGDWSAVHVHFSVADFVEPGPSEGCGSSWETCWDGEGVGVWVCLAGRVTVVSWDVLHWATTFDRVDDLEDAALGWVCVVGDRELARSSSVNSASDEGNGLR